MRRHAVHPASPSRERGSATAETAVLLPVIALLLVTSLWAVHLVVLQVRCVDAARTGARALARGESPAAVRSVAAEQAPSGARITLSGAGGLAAVDVRLTARLPAGPVLALPGLRLGSRAVAAVER